MHNNINKSVSRAVYFTILFGIIYISIQSIIYYTMDETITKNQKFLKKEHVFNIIVNNSMEIETSFLNYSFGYLPSPNTVTLLLKENKNLINNFIFKNSTIAENKYIIKFKENYSILHKNIVNYLAMNDNNLQKEILLKDINELFFINRLLFVKQRAVFDRRNKTRISEIEKVLSFNLLTILLISIMIIMAIFYSFYFKKLLLQKIKYIQDRIRSFSENNLRENNLQSIKYADKDEFKIIFDTFNQMLHTISMQHDKFKENEKKYRYLFDNSNEALMILSLNGVILDSNSATLKMFGYANIEEFKKLTPLKISPDYQEDGSLSSEKVPQMIKQSIKNGAHFFEWIHKRKNGENFDASVFMSKIKMDKISVLLTTIRDITKQKRDDERQIQVQKMASIGQLAGGIAHDFNNMLAGIMGAAQLLKSPKRNIDEKNIKFVDMILQASARAADLTAQLLAFSRKGEISSAAVDIDGVIKDTIAILSKTIDRKIQISVTNKAINHIVIGNNSGLQNVLINLGINASHAMENGGKLTFETRNVQLSKKDCEISPFEIEVGNYIEIEIRDTGHGIAAKHLTKIFEPFFTTKEQGKGTGLGLAAVYGTIQIHHGAINVYSEIGIGTVFHILLPCSGTKCKEEERINNFFTGSGKILLVDDEAIIRITGKQLLEDMGFTVLLAKDGIEAIEIFRKEQDIIDLVIMDMIMPKMNGREAFLKLKEINKNCKVIISSGFMKDENLDLLMKKGLTGFIRKPFNNFELSKILSKTMKEIIIRD